jgi:hypothetical protein
VGGEIRGRMNGKNAYTRKVNFVKGVAFDYSVYASYTPGQYYNIQASTIWPFRISCLETNFPTNFVLVSIVRKQWFGTVTPLIYRSCSENKNEVSWQLVLTQLSP